MLTVNNLSKDSKPILYLSNWLDQKGYGNWVVLDVTCDDNIIIIDIENNSVIRHFSLTINDEYIINEVTYENF